MGERPAGSCAEGPLPQQQWQRANWEGCTPHTLHRELTKEREGEGGERGEQWDGAEQQQVTVVLVMCEGQKRDQKFLFEQFKLAGPNWRQAPGPT